MRSFAAAVATKPKTEAGHAIGGDKQKGRKGSRATMGHPMSVEQYEVPLAFAKVEPCTIARAFLEMWRECSARASQM